MKPGAPMREQRPSNLLSRDENESIFSLFGPRCESLATTVVQVFVTTPPDHCEWSKLDAGVLCLVKDHLRRSYYFRLYCPERRTLVWEHEVYNSMQYNAPRPFLHTFEAQDCIVAFNFATEEEAVWLRSILLEKLESKKQRRERRMRNSYHPKETPATKPSYMTNGTVSTTNKYATTNMHAPATGGVLNNFKDGQKKSKKKNGKKLNKADIGTPFQFRHVSHVGWDVNKGFDANLGSEESPELIKFFQKAGVSDSQLQDRATRDFIYEFIQHNGGIDRAVNEVLEINRVEVPPSPNHKPIRVKDLKVVCDTMLQGLGRQLRTVGVDVEILGNTQNHNVCVALCKDQNRVILTKGAVFERLHQQVPVGMCYHVLKKTAKEQLVEVLSYYNVIVTKEDIFSRCRYCNGAYFKKLSPQELRRAISSTFTTNRPISAYELDIADDEYDEFNDFDDDDSCSDDDLPGPTVAQLPSSYVASQASATQTSTDEVFYGYNCQTNSGAHIKHESIPKEVFNKVALFYICDGCGHCYWDGSHLERILGSHLRDVVAK